MWCRPSRGFRDLTGSREGAGTSHSFVWGVHGASMHRPGAPLDSFVGTPVTMCGACNGFVKERVCAIQVFGGHVVRAPKGVMHGKTSLVYHHNRGLMKVLWRRHCTPACCSSALPSCTAEDDVLYQHFPCQRQLQPEYGKPADKCCQLDAGPGQPLPGGQVSQPGD